MLYGTELRRLREELHRQTRSMSLRKLAGLIGVSPTYLSDVERGRRPPFDPATTKRIEGFLGYQPGKTALGALAMADKIKHVYPELSDRAILDIRNVIVADLLQQRNERDRWYAAQGGGS